MAYAIRLYSEYILGNTGSIPVDDKGVYYTQSSLPMVGVGASDYAQSISEALLWQLENFAGVFPPSNALTGQLWYDTGSSELKIYNGTAWVTPFGPSSTPQDGESFVWMGVWSPSTTYSKNDVVHFAGSSYICVANSVLSSSTPSDDTLSWNIMCSAGVTGPAGVAGAVGATGASGAAGPAGISFKWRGSWVGSTAYLINDVVAKDGSTYICITANSDSSFTLSKWNVMAVGGTNGTTFTYENAYSAATTYDVNDIVTYQGSSYVSKSSGNLNKTPSTETTYWGLLASKGDAGASSFTMYVQSTQPSGVIANGSLWVKI